MDAGGVNADAEHGRKWNATFPSRFASARLFQETITVAGQRYKRLVEKLVQQGGNIAIWGCIAVALVEAGGSGTATLIPFIAGLGGNVMGNILDRATKGEQIPEAELEGALARTEDIEAFEQAVLSRMVTHEDVERLQSRFEQLIIAARSGSHHEHVQLYRAVIGASINVESPSGSACYRCRRSGGNP